jgi:NitT/TauT family transport system substrate-binding protein
MVAGCAGTKPAVKTKVNVAALLGPTGMGMVKVWDDASKGTANNDYAFTFSGAPDALIGKLTSGEVDIAAVPINLAGTLYNKTNGNIQTMAVITRGVLYVVENGNTVHSVKDLSGKLVYASGQGSTPEYILDYILKANALSYTTSLAPQSGLTAFAAAPGSASQVRVQYKAEHAEIASMLISGTAKLAMLPEPFVTTVLSKNPNLRIALDLNDAWRLATAAKGEQTELSMSALVVRKEFAQKNPEAVTAFLREYEASVNYVNANPKQAAELIVKAGIMQSVELAEKAIPNCHIVFVTGDAQVDTLTKLYRILFAANPKSIGGAMPGSDFFYTYVPAK